MNRYRLALVLVALAALVAPALAGGLFKREPKPNPKERVPELLIIVKTDRDDHKRALAAEELRQYDSTAFPEISAILIDVMLNDAKPNVRAEAAQSIGKLRPVTQQGGWALEQALSKDTSVWVRLQARTALLQYHWSGYHGTPTKVESSAGQSNEPPLAAPGKGGVPNPIPTTPPVQLAPRSGSTMSAPVTVPVNPGSLQMPVITAPVLPVEQPRLELSPPPGRVKMQGPDLGQ